VLGCMYAWMHVMSGAGASPLTLAASSLARLCHTCACARVCAPIDIIYSGEALEIRDTVAMPIQTTCVRCGYVASNQVCKACVMLEGLNRGVPRYTHPPTALAHGTVCMAVLLHAASAAIGITHRCLGCVCECLCLCVCASLSLSLCVSE
jgi:hypothetical protein